MNILLDTNIVLDIYLKRPDQYEKSFISFKTAIEYDYVCQIATTQMTDIYYILSRNKDKKYAYEALKDLSEAAEIVDSIKSDIVYALNNEKKDFEDDVLEAIAYRNKADYIITRNIKDFKNSRVKAISPQEFVNLVGRSEMRVHEDSLELY